MENFMEHVKQQPRATYVPIACAEKILEQVGKLGFARLPLLRRGRSLGDIFLNIKAVLRRNLVLRAKYRLMCTTNKKE